MKTAWLLLGFWIGRVIFRRRPCPAGQFAALVEPKELKLLAAGKTFGPSLVEKAIPKIAAYVNATVPPPRKDRPASIERLRDLGGF